MKRRKKNKKTNEIYQSTSEKKRKWKRK